MGVGGGGGGLNQVRSTRECNTGNEFCLCLWKAGAEREGRVVEVVGVVGVGGGGVAVGVLTHSFGTLVIAITGNEFCLCHWKAGTEREGQVVAVVEFNTSNEFCLCL